MLGDGRVSLSGSLSHPPASRPGELLKVKIFEGHL
jgi:hypothetical protein